MRGGRKKFRPSRLMWSKVDFPFHALKSFAFHLWILFYNTCTMLIVWLGSSRLNCWQESSELPTSGLDSKIKPRRSLFWRFSAFYSALLSHCSETEMTNANKIIAVPKRMDLFKKWVQNVILASSFSSCLPLPTKRARKALKDPFWRWLSAYLKNAPSSIANDSLFYGAWVDPDPDLGINSRISVSCVVVPLSKRASERGIRLFYKTENFFARGDRHN